MYQSGVHHHAMQPTYMHTDTNAYLHGNSGTSPMYIPTTRHSMFTSPGMNNGYMHDSTVSSAVSPPSGQLSPLVVTAASSVWGQHDSLPPATGSVLGTSVMYGGSVTGNRFPFSPSPSPPPGTRSSLPSAVQTTSHAVTPSVPTPSLLELSAGQTPISPPHQYGRSPYSTPAASASYISGTDMSSAWGSVGYGGPHPHGLGFHATTAAGYMLGYGKSRSELKIYFKINFLFVHPGM